MRINHNANSDGNKAGDTRIVERFMYLPFYDVETNTTYWWEAIKVQEKLEYTLRLLALGPDKLSWVFDKVVTDETN